jgi:predicted DCC family thiol-disulfide oxidoreductase YuxK
MITVAGEKAPVSVVPAVGDAGRSYTVIYDGTCGVCARTVRVLENWDRNHVLAIIPSQAPGVRDRFPWIPASAYADSIQVIRSGDGRTWQGAAALEELLKVLPRGGVISWLFNIPFARPLGDRFYAWFARNRYRMSCREHCAVRPPDRNSRGGAGGSK